MVTIVIMYCEIVSGLSGIFNNNQRRGITAPRQNNTTNSFGSNSLNLLRSLKPLKARQSRTSISAGMNKETFIIINIAAVEHNWYSQGADFADSKKPVFVEVKYFVMKKIIQVKVKKRAT